MRYNFHPMGKYLGLPTLKHIFCFSVSFLICISTFSQTEITHYVFPEFNEGIILMKTGIKNIALLNYNSLTHEMVFEKKGEKLAITEDEIRQVDTVFISDRKFIVLSNKFVELVYHSKNHDLYVEHRCNLRAPGKPAGYGGTSETGSVTTYSNLNFGGNVYNLTLPDGYETESYPYYWITKKGELEKIINMRQLKKLFRDKEDLFKDYLKANDVQYENQEDVIQLIVYLESN